MTTPNLALPELIGGQSQPHIPVNGALRRLDALVQLSVLDRVASVPDSGDSPPPQDGDRYILTANDSPGVSGQIAYYSGGWQFVTPEEGWIAYVVDEEERYEYTSGGWIIYDPGASAGPTVVEFQVALSDLTTALTTGNSKAYFRAPCAFTLTAVRSSLLTASSSGLVTVDINEAGATILSTKLSIDATEKTSVTAATPAVISDANIADDAELTFDIDAAGTTAVGLVVTLIGTR